MEPGGSGDGRPSVFFPAPAVKEILTETGFLVPHRSPTLGSVGEQLTMRSYL